MPSRLVALLALCGSLVGLSAAFSADRKNLYDNVAATSDLSIFLSALTETDQAGLLKVKEGGTVFAPTDEAWKKFNDEQLTKLIADKVKLRKIVLAHIVPGQVLTVDKLKGMNGQDQNGFRISTSDGLKVGVAKVIGKETLCSNGVLHTIDRVLVPE